MASAMALMRRSRRSQRAATSATLGSPDRARRRGSVGHLASLGCAVDQPGAFEDGEVLGHCLSGRGAVGSPAWSVWIHRYRGAGRAAAGGWDRRRPSIPHRGQRSLRALGDEPFGVGAQLDQEGLPTVGVLGGVGRLGRVVPLDCVQPRFTHHQAGAARLGLIRNSTSTASVAVGVALWRSGETQANANTWAGLRSRRSARSLWFGSSPYLAR